MYKKVILSLVLSFVFASASGQFRGITELFGSVIEEGGKIVEFTVDGAELIKEELDSNKTKVYLKKKLIEAKDKLKSSILDENNTK